MLQMKVEELNELCLLCSTKMHANIGLVQDEVTKIPNSNQDIDMIYLALAGLKQVFLIVHKVLKPIVLNVKS